MSKVLLMPLPPEDIREGIYSVIGGALAGGAPPPSWVAVDDGTDSWIVEVSNRPASERMCGVVATASEEALLTAQLLGVGGAMWLPPASLGALEAFEAAGAAAFPMPPDVVGLELLEGDASIQVVTFADRSFWRAQLGDRELAGLLAELATALGTPASILQWPALVVAHREASEIVETWNQHSRVGGALGLQVFALARAEDGAGQGILDVSVGALLNGSPALESPGSREMQPVHELPHGRRVGCWGLEETELEEEEGWRSTPVEITPTKCRWKIENADRSGTAAEVFTGKEVAGLEDVVAARIPGWACRELRPGSPAGLLAARIAEATARRGLPLWIPGVDDEALRYVLGLPGVIWVDGPAVPDH